MHSFNELHWANYGLAKRFQSYHFCSKMTDFFSWPIQLPLAAGRGGGVVAVKYSSSVRYDGESY